MKRVSALTLIVVLVACGSDQRDVTPSTATTTAPPTTLTSQDTPNTTTTTLAPTTTTSVKQAGSDDPGTESVGVTDKVTIIILDPED